MEKLIAYAVAGNKLVQRDGNPAMAGWGLGEINHASVLKTMRDSGKHIVIVAHVQRERR